MAINLLDAVNFTCRVCMGKTIVFDAANMMVECPACGGFGQFIIDPDSDNGEINIITGKQWFVVRKS